MAGSIPVPSPSNRSLQAAPIAAATGNERITEREELRRVTSVQGWVSAEDCRGPTGRLELKE